MKQVYREISLSGPTGKFPNFSLTVLPRKSIIPRKAGGNRGQGTGKVLPSAPLFLVPHLKKFFRAIWFCVRWGLLIGVVLAVIAAVYVLQQLNSLIREQVVVEIQARFPDLDVYVGSVELSESKGIAIRKVELSLPATHGTSGQLLFAAEEVFVECPVTLQAFFNKKLEISRYVLKNPIFRLTRLKEGHFDELRYFQLRDKPRPFCPVEIQNGTFLYDDLGDKVYEPTKITGLDISVTPPGTQSPALWTVAAKGKSDFIRQLSIEGTIDPETGQWAVSGKVLQLDWTADLLGFLPLTQPIHGNANLQKTLDTFQGRADIHFSAVRDEQAPLGCRFAFEGILDQGRAEIFELGRIVTDLNAKFCVTNDEIVIDRLTGLGEAARFTVSYRQKGLTERRNASLTAKVKGLSLDREFVQAIHPFLNERTRRLVARFGHSGTGDLSTELTFADGVWKPRYLDVQFTELNFVFLEFPYSVERLGGKLHIDDAGKIGFDLLTKHGEAVWVQVRGSYENIFDDPTGQVEIRGVDVPIDAKLMKTIPPQYLQVVRSLHPIGKVNAVLRFGLPPGRQPLQKHIEIGLNKVAVQYDKFPYPLRDIDGQLVLDDDHWTFRNIRGENESAKITLEGHLRPLPKIEGTPLSHEFELRILADDLPVDGQILDALLNPSYREQLTGLQAKGKVNLDALVRYHSAENNLSVGFHAKPCPGLQICSKNFPYKIDNVQGEIVYDNGVVVAENLRGNNRDTKFSSGIYCRFSPDGSWNLRIHPLMVDQLPPYRELRDALPPSLQTIFENLQLRKAVNLRGAVEFYKAGPDAPLRTAWDLGIHLHQNSVNLGLTVDNIFGKVRLMGTSEDNDFRLGGELGIESATIYGCQVTDLYGPFFYEGSQHQVFLGQPSQIALGPPPGEISDAMPIRRAFQASPWFVKSPTARPLSGCLFDGKFLSEGRVTTGNSMTYSVYLNLFDANLAQFAKELEPGVRNVEGKLNAGIHLSGMGHKMETLGGNGAIQLRNANIYELPAMMRLLRELSIRDVSEKTGAFSSADVNFRIKGNTVFLDPLIFDGNAFNLQGSGTMRLDDRTVELMMGARLGNRRSQIPIISPVLGGVGDQFVQLSVHGSLSEPTFSRVLVPGVQRAIREIQGDEAAVPTPQTDRNTGPGKLFPWR